MVRDELIKLKRKAQTKGGDFWLLSLRSQQRFWRCWYVACHHRFPPVVLSHPHIITDLNQYISPVYFFFAAADTEFAWKGNYHVVKRGGLSLQKSIYRNAWFVVWGDRSIGKRWREHAADTWIASFKYFPECPYIWPGYSEEASWGQTANLLPGSSGSPLCPAMVPW